MASAGARLLLLSAGLLAAAAATTTAGLGSGDPGEPTGPLESPTRTTTSLPVRRRDACPAPALRRPPGLSFPTRGPRLPGVQDTPREGALAPGAVGGTVSAFLTWDTDA